MSIFAWSDVSYPMLEPTVSRSHGRCSADLKLEEAAKHLVILRFTEVQGSTTVSVYIVHSMSVFIRISSIQLQVYN